MYERVHWLHGCWHHHGVPLAQADRPGELLEPPEQPQGLENLAALLVFEAGGGQLQLATAVGMTGHSLLGQVELKKQAFVLLSMNRCVTQLYRPWSPKLQHHHGLWPLLFIAIPRGSGKVVLYMYTVPGISVRQLKVKFSLVKAAPPILSAVDANVHIFMNHWSRHPPPTHV